jgi:hypothetical protein
MGNDDSWTEYTDALDEQREEERRRQDAERVCTRKKIYEMGSPQLRGRMDAEERKEEGDRPPKIGEARRKARSEKRLQFFAMVVSGALGLALAVLLAYGVIKLVKWAWLN